MIHEDRTVEQAAQDFIDRYGADAPRILRECAETAAELGDELAAKTWRDIASTAERILANPI